MIPTPDPVPVVHPNGFTQEQTGTQAAAQPAGSSTVTPNRTATAASAHQMMVAVIILTAFVMLSTIVAGQSKTVGNGIAAFFGIMLVAQGIGRVNPFVAWIAAHPLTPKPA